MLLGFPKLGEAPPAGGDEVVVKSSKKVPAAKRLQTGWFSFFPLLRKVSSDKTFSTTSSAPVCALGHLPQAWGRHCMTCPLTHFVEYYSFWKALSTP